MIELQPIIFHGRKNPESNKRTHTLCVSCSNLKMYVTWSKLFKGNIFDNVKPDIYCRKTGRDLVLEKMDRFLTTPPRRIIDYTESYNENSDLNNYISLRKFIFSHIPAVVADTLPWYLSCASRYFKLKDCIVQVEGYDDTFNTSVRATITFPLKDILFLVDSKYYTE